MTTSTRIDNSVYKRELARQKFPAYCEYVHGEVLLKHFPSPVLCAHLQAWAEVLERPEDDLIISPPQTFKSSLFRWYIEYVMGKYPDRPIVYVMNTATQASRQVMAVEATIESSEKYKEVFPHVRPDKPKGWSHDTAYIVRETTHPDPSLFATGWNGPYQGMHPYYLFLDDLTDPQDVESGAIMESQRKLLTSVLEDRREPGGQMKAILTRWGESDLVPTFREMGFRIIEQPVEGEYRWGGNRLLCPELYPDDRIEELKKKKGSFYFLTYMCNPAAATGSMIKREWWRYFGELPEFIRIIQSWDTSTGRKGGDYSAYGTWGVTKEGYYLIDAGRWRLTSQDLVDKMNLLYQSFRPQWVLVEDVGTAIPLNQMLEKETRIPLKLIKPGTLSKEARVKGITPMIESKRVWLPKGQPWVQEFVDECAGFPSGQYDDQVDQMTQALDFLEFQGSGTVEGYGAYVEI